MKKTVALLNNRERNEFEEIYQWFKNFPGWNMENVFVNKTNEHTECEKFPRISYINGKATRLSLAAHEAGHALAIVATHRLVDKAVIDVENHPEGWLGFVASCRHKDSGDSQPIKQEGMPCKPLVIINILIESAGFVGESFVGKRTGSNHEKFVIYCRCRHLDDMDEVEPLTNWVRYVEWCRKIILKNETLFWRIIDAKEALKFISETRPKLMSAISFIDGERTMHRAAICSKLAKEAHDEMVANKKLAAFLSSGDYDMSWPRYLMCCFPYPSERDIQIAADKFKASNDFMRD